jgi:hypothetical protein
MPHSSFSSISQLSAAEGESAALGSKRQRAPWPRAEDEGVHTIVSPPLAECGGPFCVPNVTVSVLPETAMLDAVPLAPNAVKPLPIAPALSERLPRNGSGESEVR